MGNISRVDVLVQFSEGSALVWNNTGVPVPLGAIIIDTANKIMKEGDGTTLYADLPVCFDYNFNGVTSAAASLDGGDDNSIAVAKSSAYNVDPTKLQSILNQLVAYQAKEGAQDTRIAGLNSGILVGPVVGGDEGSIVMCDAGIYKPGTTTIAQFIADLIANATLTGQQAHIADIIWYTDVGLTQRAPDQQILSEGQKYWTKIDGFHDSTMWKNVDFSLGSSETDILVPAYAGITSTILTSIYGSSESDDFLSLVVDSSGNIFCCGRTLSGASSANALIVKFDSNFNILAHKTYNGNGSEYFKDITIDSSGNVIVAGYSSGDGVTNGGGMIVKFTADLSTVLAAKKYDGGSLDSLDGIVLDSNDNIFCTGYTTSEGTGSDDCIIIKFDNDLNKLAAKVYGGTLSDRFEDVIVDSQDNVFVVGYTLSSGSTGGEDALVMKFDNSLNVIAKKIYGGTSAEYFRGVAIDSSDNVICAGLTVSEGGGSNDTLVVKFDNDLNKIAGKTYGGSGSDLIHGVEVDSSDNIIIVGYTSGEGEGAEDALLVKFDSSLNILDKKIYGGTGIDFYYAVTSDSSDNIICCGVTNSEGLGNYTGLVVKLSSTIPSGTLSGNVLTNLTLQDSNLTLANSNLTLKDSTLTLADSNLTLADISFTLANANLTQEKDTISVTVGAYDAYVDSAITITGSDGENKSILMSLYGGSGNDLGYATTTDSAGNIICTGYTTSEGTGTESAFIVKFDSNMNILAKKIYTASAGEYFYGVKVDSNGNIIVAGGSNSGPQSGDVLVVKFDSDLNILAEQLYRYPGADTSYSLAIDSNDRIFVVGYTDSGGPSDNALILKIDTDLTLLDSKVYSGASSDYFKDVAIDSADNIFVAGYTFSEGAGQTDGLIYKFDNDLNLIVRKRYGGASGEEFYGVVIDSLDNVICVGATVSEGAGDRDALIIKFDGSLNILARKVIGGGGAGIDDRYYDVAVDSSNNILAVGWAYYQSSGGNDSLLTKFDSDLNVLSSKMFGGSGYDVFRNVAVDVNDNVICAGYTDSDGGGGYDVFIVKLQDGLVPGTFSSPILSGITIKDVDLTVSDSVLTLADSSLGFVDYVVVSVVPVITLSDSTLTQEKDTIWISHATPPTKMLTAIYGGTGNDSFKAITVDSADNVFCTGFTNSEGSDAGLITKFDSNMNVISRKVYGTTGEVYLFGITVDSTDNVIVVGKTNSEGQGDHDALVIKFDNNLTILARKVYGGISADLFNAVAVDSSDNVYCAGSTLSEGQGVADVLIVKLGSDLSVLTKKVLGSSGGDYFFGIAIDSDDNIYCCGSTTSQGAGNHDGLIVKFNTDLTILLQKVYGGSTLDQFKSVVIDSADNVFCTGFTNSEGAGDYDGLVVKFDSSLTILARKIRGGSGVEQLLSSSVDSDGNVITVGMTDSVGASSYDFIITKYDNDLNVVGEKTLGSVASDTDYAVVVNSNDDIIVTGSTDTNGLVAKLPGSLPSGTYSNKYHTSLVLSDSSLASSNSNLTLASSTLTITDSTLTLADSTQTMIDGTGAVTKDTTIFDAVSNVFEIEVSHNVVSQQGANVPVTFTVTTDDGDETTNKTVDVEVKHSDILISVYGGSDYAASDQFKSTCIDSNGNIFAAGYTTSMSGDTYALIVKYDSSLNILAEKAYGAGGDTQLHNIIADASDNVIAVGHSNADGAGSYDGLIVKFGNDLTITTSKTYGGSGADYFRGVVIDSSGNIFVTGYTLSEGQGNNDCLVVKFNASLNILARKIYGGSGADYFWSIAIDSADELYCCGYDNSSGGGNGSAMLVKFGNDLTVLLSKHYWGSGVDRFNAITVDADDNVFAVGATDSEGPGGNNALIVKFDSDLNILAKKYYGGDGTSDNFHTVTINSLNQVITAGNVNSEGVASDALLFIKFDTDLNILERKILGGTGSESCKGITVDSNDSIIGVGYTNSEGAGGSDTVVIRFPSTMRSGTYVGNTLTNLVFEDSTLALVNSTLTYANTSLTLANSTLTLSLAVLTLFESTLSQESDIIG